MNGSTGTVYGVRNAVGDFVYIGATQISMLARKQYHLNRSANGSMVPFHQYIREVGTESLTWVEMETGLDYETLMATESELIHLHQMTLTNSLSKSKIKRATRNQDRTRPYIPRKPRTQEQKDATSWAMLGRKNIKVRVVETGKVYKSLGECARDLDLTYSNLYNQVVLGQPKQHTELTIIIGGN